MLDPLRTLVFLAAVTSPGAEAGPPSATPPAAEVAPLPSVSALSPLAEEVPPPEATRDDSLVWLGVAGAVVLLLLAAGRVVGRRRQESEAEEVPEPDEPEAEEEPAVEPEPEPEPRQSWGLAKTRREGFVARIGHLLKKRETVDQEFLDELEETLFKADIGVRTTESLLSLVREEMSAGAGSDRLWALLRQRSLELLDLPQPEPILDGPGPYVVLLVGVNGSGKTTTIGKLARTYADAGRTVLLAAGDTFRAAASEQLDVWAGRVGAPIVRGKEGADPSSVIFDGIQQASRDGIDVVIADTAGRLHTKTPLMEELKKIHRVCGKARAGAPHEVLLVVDATNGQNAILQARDFHSAIDVTGIVLTKLDGTAKGGVILGVCDELSIPVRYVGVGEQAGDLREFSAAAFVDELFTVEEA